MVATATHSQAKSTSHLPHAPSDAPAPHIGSTHQPQTHTSLSQPGPNNSHPAPPTCAVCSLLAFRLARSALLQNPSCKVATPEVLLLLFARIPVLLCTNQPTPPQQLQTSQCHKKHQSRPPGHHDCPIPALQHPRATCCASSLPLLLSCVSIQQGAAGGTCPHAPTAAAKR